MKKTILLLIATLITAYSNSQELIIGEERIDPGIILIFEGAIKDEVFPKSNNLNVNDTNIHIEARVNWDSSNIPDGAPANGFVPYLYINSIPFLRIDIF